MTLFSITRSFRIRPAKNKRAPNQCLTQARPDKKFENCRRWATVTALLESNPFPNKPPIYVRAQFYDYTFANSGKYSDGQWWDRKLLGLYFPAVRLNATDSVIGHEP